MARTHVLRSSMILPQPLETVFEFFRRAENLEAITPPRLRFRILSAPPISIRQGTVIDYDLRLFGWRFGWTSLITSWNPPYAFTDEQVKGPYAEWVHHHRFAPRAGGTVVSDEVHYRLPLAPLSLLALPVVKLQLKQIFAFRERAIRKLLATP